MRRVGTGHDAQGCTVDIGDGSPCRTLNVTGWPGCVSSLGWSPGASAPVCPTREDATGTVTMVPTAGSTRLVLLTVPPTSTMAGADGDGALFGDAAAGLDMPVSVCAIDDSTVASAARELYQRAFTLVRPDGYVAWRSDDMPAAPRRVLDVVRGASQMNAALADIGDVSVEPTGEPVGQELAPPS